MQVYAHSFDMILYMFYLQSNTDYVFKWQLF